MNADFLAKTVGDCYTVDVTFQDVEVSCLLDPGSQVTTISEGFYREHLEPRGLVLKEIPSPFTLVSANGSNIPYIGCFETDIKVLGEIVRERVVLVLADSAERKEPDLVQVILRMNVLQECWERIEPPGQGYLTRLNQSNSKQAWQKTMKFMSDRSKLGDEGGRVGKAYLSGGSVVISARQSVIIEGQIPAGNGVKFDAVLEPDRDGAIPRGVIVPPCFVEVQDGKFSLAVHNEGESELVLPDITRLGHLYLGERCCQDQPTLEASGTAGICRISTETKEEHDFPVPAGVDCSVLDVEQVDKLKELLLQHKEAFSTTDDDVGYTDAITHRIDTGSEAPIRQRHRPLPPSQYQLVRQHIQDLLERGIIQESQSPWLPSEDPGSVHYEANSSSVLGSEDSEPVATAAYVLRPQGRPSGDIPIVSDDDDEIGGNSTRSSGHQEMGDILSSSSSVSSPVPLPPSSSCAPYPERVNLGVPPDKYADFHMS